VVLLYRLIKLDNLKKLRKEDDKCIQYACFSLGDVNIHKVVASGTSLSVDYSHPALDKESDSHQARCHCQNRELE
jgi:hypothetical protein